MNIEKNEPIQTSENGFTLLEVLVAMAVLTVGILGLFAMQTNSISGNSRANHLTIASTWCVTQLETIAGLPYDDTAIDDTDGDGTGQDTNHDGIDDSNSSFGLEDDTAATADSTTNSPDGNYTIFINVAVDTPMPNLKTIYVHVQDNKQLLSNPVVFKYYKDDII